MSHVVAPRPTEVRRLRLARTGAEPVLAIGVFVATAGLAAANGGFFASSWGWSALGLLWLAIVALIVRQIDRPTTTELWFGAAAVLVAAWTWTVGRVVRRRDAIGARRRAEHSFRRRRWRPCTASPVGGRCGCSSEQCSPGSSPSPGTRS